MELVILNGIPHWRHEGVTLPVMAGGDHRFGIGDFDTSGVTTNVDELRATPIRSPLGHIIAYQVPGFSEPLTPEEYQSLLDTGRFPEPVVTPQQFAPPAPPAFSGTQQGLAFQAQLDLERQRLVGQQGFDVQRLAGTQAMDRTRLQESEAFRRLEAQMGTDRAIAMFEANEAFRRTVLTEIGAGARADISAFTTQRGQSISAVQDIFGRLGDLATQPSDFRRLAFNVEGIQPPGSTPTDDLRTRMREFFQQQIGFAGREPESFADVFNRTREQVGVPAAGTLQFGGKPKSRASIVGETGPELVFDASRVIPNLSKSEMRALSGVGKAQFGENLFTEEEPFLSSIRRGEPQSFSPRAFNTPGITASGFQAPSLPSFSQFQSLLPFQQQMLFGAFGEEVRPGRLVQGPTGREVFFASPEGLRGLPSFGVLQALMARGVPGFGSRLSAEEFAQLGPRTGTLGMAEAQEFEPISRAGFDPSSVLAAIRRFSPIGVTPQVTAFG